MQSAVYSEPEPLKPRGNAESGVNFRHLRRWLTDPPRWEDWERFLHNEENEPLFSTIELVRDLERNRAQPEFSTVPFRTYYSRLVVRTIAKIYLRLELHHRDYANFTIGESHLIASRLLRLLWTFGSDIVLALRGPATLEQASFKERYNQVVLATTNLPSGMLTEITDIMKKYDDQKFDSLLTEQFYRMASQHQEENELSI